MAASGSACSRRRQKLWPSVHLLLMKALCVAANVSVVLSLPLWETWSSTATTFVVTHLGVVDNTTRQNEHGFTNRRSKLTPVARLGATAHEPCNHAACRLLFLTSSSQSGWGCGCRAEHPWPHLVSSAIEPAFSIRIRIVPSAARLTFLPPNLILSEYFVRHGVPHPNRPNEVNATNVTLELSYGEEWDSTTSTKQLVRNSFHCTGVAACDSSVMNLLFISNILMGFSTAERAILDEGEPALSFLSSSQVHLST